MSANTVHQPLIDATWAHRHLTDVQRLEVILLVDPTGAGTDLFSVEYDVIDIPLLRAKWRVRDDKGDISWHLDPVTDEIIIDYAVTEHPVVKALPEWWRPVKRA